MLSSREPEMAIRKGAQAGKSSSAHYWNDLLFEENSASLTYSRMDSSTSLSELTVS